MNQNNIAPDFLKNLTLEEIQQYKILLEAEEKNKRKEVRNEILLQIHKLISDNQIYLHEIKAKCYKGKNKALKKERKEKVNKGGSRVLPKYANPSNPKQTWSGRGKRPKWFVDLVSSGKDPESFKV